MHEAIAAILSSVLFNLSLTLQAVDAQRASSRLSFRLALFGHLVQRRLWLIGSVLGLTAVALEIVALTRLPLTLVQPVIAAGVLILPFSALLILKERLAVGALISSALIVLGVALLASSVPVARHVSPPTTPSLVVLPVAALVTYVALRGVSDALLLCVIAGVAYGGTSILSKLIAVGGSWTGALVTFLDLGCFGAVGFLSEMSALQRLSPTRAAPAILGLTTVVPVAAGRLWLDEAWPNTALTLAGIMLALVPALWIAGHTHLTPPAPRLGSEEASVQIALEYARGIETSLERQE